MPMLGRYRWYIQVREEIPDPDKVSGLYAFIHDRYDDDRCIWRAGPFPFPDTGAAIEAMRQKLHDLGEPLDDDA